MTHWKIEFLRSCRLYFCQIILLSSLEEILKTIQFYHSVVLRIGNRTCDSPVVGIGTGYQSSNSLTCGERGSKVGFVDVPKRTGLLADCQAVFAGFSIVLAPWEANRHQSRTRLRHIPCLACRSRRRSHRCISLCFQLTKSLLEIPKIITTSNNFLRVQARIRHMWGCCRDFDITR